MTGKYALLVEPRARKNLAHIDPVIRRRIAAAIDALAGDPEPPGCKALRGSHWAMRIRVGDYRIVYKVNHAVNTVVIGRSEAIFAPTACEIHRSLATASRPLLPAATASQYPATGRDDERSAD